jgi:GNAT superfamily N-acetyltransferase
MTFTHRLATEADLPAIKALMEVAIAEHLKDFLDPAQVELSKSIMGLDTQLIADRTYFLVEEDRRLAGCGGWSRRATLYGGDHSTSQRNAALLDMAKDAARIRAMYTHPDFKRRGVGRLISRRRRRRPSCRLQSRGADGHHVWRAALSRLRLSRHSAHRCRLEGWR